MDDLFEQPLSLAGDVLFLRTAEGVEIKGSRDALRLRGEDTYRLLERLAPHLRGERPLRPMIEALPENKREAVTRLCTLLHDHDFLRPAGGIDAIAQYAGHFGRGVEAFQREPFIVRGSLARGICHALIELGARRISIEGERDARIEQYAAGRAEVSFRDAASGDDVVASSFTISIRQFARWSVIGPLLGNGLDSCASCARGAVAAHEDEIAAKPGWSIDVPGPRPPASLSLIGNIVALELFRALTGAGAVRLDRRVALVNPATLELALLLYRCGCGGDRP
jgi:hypothetical protein